MGITITETRVQDQSSSALNIKDIINIVYPVGSIYMSVNDTDPSLLFHGTWERIKDRFLLAAGDTYSAGSTGGEAQHTLTVDEMPSHSHTIRYNIGTDDSNFSSVYGELEGGDSNDYNHTYTSSASGGGQSHNNMPPYLTVYMWKRIA